jgi:hypothetical protein
METVKRRGGASLPRVPLRSPLDPVPYELIVHFFDAVARKTDAFRELRDTVLPTFNPPWVPEPGIKRWVQKWHLDSFEDYEVNEKIESLAFQVLGWWKRDPTAAKELRVDLGELEQSTRTVRISCYDGLEKPADYRARILAGCERLINEEIATFDRLKEKYDLRECKRRDRSRDLSERFDWLALSLCEGKSDTEIAQACRMHGTDSLSAQRHRDRIRKGREALYRQGFRPVGK